MECPECYAKMEQVECVTDFADDSKPYAHGQWSNHVWICSKCKHEIYEGED